LALELVHDPDAGKNKDPRRRFK